MRIQPRMLLCSLPLWAGLAFAQKPLAWEPPTTASVPAARATIKHEILSNLRVSGLNIALGDTALSEAQKRLGGTIGHRGDASESLSWLCLHGNHQTGKWILWLMSAETDGGTVGGFRWERLQQSTRVDDRCQALHGEHVINLPIKLPLGSTETDAMHLLGQPSQRLGDRCVYVHSHQETKNNDRYTATNTVLLYLHHGIVWAIETWKSTMS